MGDFSAAMERDAVRLTWLTADESEILGFNVLRRSGPETRPGDFVAVNGELILASHMGVAVGNSYTYLDEDFIPGDIYEYQLEIVKLDGASEFYGLVRSGERGPLTPAPPAEQESVE